MPVMLGVLADFLRVSPIVQAVSPLFSRRVLRAG